MSTVRVVFVGDGAVGKTCLLITQCSGGFPKTIETQRKEYTTAVKILEKRYPVTMIDTQGQDEDDRTRPNAYTDTDVFCICFSIISPYSFENVRKKWHPELLRYAPGKPILLVGTKMDLRDDEDARDRLSQKKLAPISFDHAFNMKQEIRAYQYIECSAAQHYGLDTLMAAIVESVHGPIKGIKRRSKAPKQKKPLKGKEKNIANQSILIVRRSEVRNNRNKQKVCTVL
eukprot:TRINITY_DN272_c1_g1_i1.p1 TRINITY_DN272_c1_g1~~TRINITY_DN272_c1_g1_i1.p1  ORF type:complete len:254 (-),score=39.83 TRINITY_DN272_c1_g1_i1:82-768(-)